MPPHIFSLLLIPSLFITPIPICHALQSLRDTHFPTATSAKHPMQHMMPSFGPCNHFRDEYLLYLSPFSIYRKHHSYRESRQPLGPKAQTLVLKWFVALLGASWNSVYLLDRRVLLSSFIFHRLCWVVSVGWSLSFDCVHENNQHGWQGLHVLSSPGNPLHGILTSFYDLIALISLVSLVRCLLLVSYEIANKPSIVLGSDPTSWQAR